MKSLLLFRNVRPDVSQYTEVIKGMMFADETHGQQIKDFNQYDPSFDKYISMQLGEDLKTTENSGFFRLPYEVIHFETISANHKWLFVLAYEDTKIQFFSNKETGSEFVTTINKSIDDIMFDCVNEDKWDVSTEITLKCGDAVCFNPLMLHKISSSLVQIFYIENNNV